MSTLEGVQLGLAIGAVPTIAMATASALMTQIEVSSETESMFQYFASGLIIAAVAQELFPLLSNKVTANESMVGISCGFAIGLVMVYGMEILMSSFDDDGAEETKDGVSGGAYGYVPGSVPGAVRARSRQDSLIRSFGVIINDGDGASGGSTQEGTSLSPDSSPVASYDSMAQVQVQEQAQLNSSGRATSSSSSSTGGGGVGGGNLTPSAVGAGSSSNTLGGRQRNRSGSNGSNSGLFMHSAPRAATSSIPTDDVETIEELKTFKQLDEDLGDWLDDDVQKSHLAILNPRHRLHVYDHLKEITDAINDMEEKSALLTESDRSIREQEDVAEKIDEGVHKLQYLLDHTRRLVEGAESEITGTSTKVWMTDDRKKTMRRRIAALKYSANHLLEHMHVEQDIDLDELKEVLTLTLLLTLPLALTLTVTLTVTLKKP